MACSPWLPRLSSSRPPHSLRFTSSEMSLCALEHSELLFQRQFKKNWEIQRLSLRWVPKLEFTVCVGSTVATLRTEAEQTRRNERET